MELNGCIKKNIDVIRQITKLLFFKKNILQKRNYKNFPFSTKSR